MSLYIRNAEADRLARQLTERTGETLTEAVVVALRERLERTPEKTDDIEARLARIRAIQDRVAAAPVVREGSDEELLYDADGLPK
ncbi:type II toxin-antitoxin system VapB family antitoxin [Caulobacter endophyticus]|uniref:type II toxin-antitoxin system VapB family antitoxin n=1 Tax=Caulobacter endophyticus TaxID=2172652 RepID=UPI002410A02D|nr:type II toxin-antitoxin system VapB family antitoxin [Caulobacter endophyticus]MDG2529592.1 type II toxin-antitoxin system VapB family antitoxin [Caulobacter endophyticus]